VAGNSGVGAVFLREIEHHGDGFIDRHAARVLEERHRAERIERAVGLARRKGDDLEAIGHAHLLALPDHAQAATAAREIVDADHRQRLR
jgi:hypothetical protein